MKKRRKNKIGCRLPKYNFGTTMQGINTSIGDTKLGSYFKSNPNIANPLFDMSSQALIGLTASGIQDLYSSLTEGATEMRDMTQNTNASFGNGTGKSGIHIKPQNKGKFTSYAKSKGLSVQQAASKILANKENYSSTLVKRANFAKNASKWKKANGSGPEGIVDENVNVELEGKEMIETPIGNVEEIQGPSHEQGGVPASLPEGTKVYSDRIKVQGKTLATRKKHRDILAKKMEKILDKDSTNQILKNTALRTLSNISKEEVSDLELQEQIDMQQEMVDSTNAGMEMAYGGTTKKMYQNGTGPGGVDPINQIQPGQGPISGNISVDVGSIPFQGEDSFLNQLSLMDTVNNMNFGDGMQVDELQATDETMTPNYSGVDPITGTLIPMDFPGLPTEVPGLNNPAENAPQNNQSNTGYDFTLGDTMGFAGNFLGGIGPLATTILNRGGDTANINAFKNYGKEGLQTLQGTKGLMGQVRDQQLSDLELQETEQYNRMANSARGVNTLRGLNQAVFAGGQRARGAINNSYAQQMAQILGQEAQMENQQDQMVMQGEQARDLADRQDRDNYFTQLGQNLANMSEFMQSTGKNLNQLEYNKNFLAAANELSKYGLGYEKVDGKYQIVQKKKYKTTDDRGHEVEVTTKKGK